MARLTHTTAPARAATAPERLVVKWADPSEEALGTAKLARALVDRKIAAPGEIRIFAPNRLWAENILRACASANAKATLLIPQQCDDAVLAALADETVARLKGLSLVRKLGLDKRPEFAHALLHVRGDESPEELRTLVEEQFARPTMPANATHIGIALADDAQPVDYAFLIGCVNGLAPGWQAFESTDPEERRAYAEASRSIFTRAIGAGRKRTTASCFAKAPIELARFARLRHARTKTENGQVVAMMQPSSFLTEAGSWRPTTTGGQALLRKYGLN